ncbi:hypothetical protein PG985_001658 [Apiospora marii]|uniref:uncharacterized protein n=1 Tax=Apiospora marii TaxID=335849 RepID=UPI0031311A0D
MKTFEFTVAATMALLPSAWAQSSPSSGCYLNPNGYRSGFSESFDVLNSAQLTAQSCQQYCSRYGTKLYAVQERSVL